MLFIKSAPDGVEVKSFNRNSFSYIKLLKNAIESNLSLHLKGEIDESGMAVGCHLQDAVDGIRVKILPNPPAKYDILTNELLEAKIEINGIPKVALSTFFPKGWNTKRVLEESVAVVINPSYQIGTNFKLFKGLATDGVTIIEVRLDGTVTNPIFRTTYRKLN